MKIGIDIVHIPKIGETIKKWGDKFLNRVFSEEEIMFCRKRKDSVTCFAGRFAAKEAVYKTLGKTISLKSISISLWWKTCGGYKGRNCKKNHIEHIPPW